MSSAPATLVLPRPGQADAQPAHHRRSARRLPPDRRRDGLARPGRHPRGARAHRAARAGRSRSSARAVSRSWWGHRRTNLVHRALILAGRSARMRVTKRIRPGAGLGGGSADAAAVLRWAGWTTWPLPPSWARTCPSAWWAAGPGCAASASWSSRCRSRRPRSRCSRRRSAARRSRSTARWDRLGGPTGERDGNDLDRPPWRSSPGWSNGATGWRGHRPRAPPGRQRLHLVRGRRLPRRRTTGGPDDPGRGVTAEASPEPGRLSRRVTASANRPQASMSSSSGRASGRTPAASKAAASTRPANERRSILRRWPNPVRTRANSRSTSLSTAGRAAALDVHQHRLDPGLGQEHRGRHPPDHPGGGPVGHLHRRDPVGGLAGGRGQALPHLALDHDRASGRWPARRRAGRRPAAWPRCRAGWPPATSVGGGGQHLAPVELQGVALDHRHPLGLDDLAQHGHDMAIDLHRHHGRPRCRPGPGSGRPGRRRSPPRGRSRADLGQPDHPIHRVGVDHEVLAQRPAGGQAVGLEQLHHLGPGQPHATVSLSRHQLD